MESLQATKTKIAEKAFCLQEIYTEVILRAAGPQNELWLTNSKITFKRMESYDRFEVVTDIDATQLEIGQEAIRFYNGDHVFVR